VATPIESPLADARSNRPGLDLLQYRPVRALVRWPGFPALFQAMALIVFCALAILG
jgi:hypothetical protein